MQNFIRKPSIDLMPGIRVTKDTNIEFANKNVKQTVCNLKLCTISEISGENYESKCVTTIHLEEGDILLLEEDGRGYIKPVEGFVTIEEAIDDLSNIKDLG